MMLRINIVNKRFDSQTGFNVNKYADTVKERYNAKSIMRTLAFLTNKETIIEA